MSTTLLVGLTTAGRRRPGPLCAPTRYNRGVALADARRGDETIAHYAEG